MCKARDSNQSPSRPRSAVAYVSDAFNSVKRKEPLAVILHNKFDAAFDSWKIRTVLREGSRVYRLSLSWEPFAPPRPPKGGPHFQVGVTETVGPCSSQRDRPVHWGFCIVGTAMVPFLQAKQKKPWV